MKRLKLLCLSASLRMVEKDLAKELKKPCVLQLTVRRKRVTKTTKRRMWYLRKILNVSRWSNPK